MKKFIGLFMFLATATSVAHADVVSLNFESWGNAPTGATPTAGLVNVPYWNDTFLEATRDTGAGVGTDGVDDAMFNLRNSDGVATTLDVSWKAGGVWSINNNAAPGADADGTLNSQVLKGYLDARPGLANATTTVTISENPYSKFDLYVYFSSDVAGRTGSITVNGTYTYYFTTYGPASVAANDASGDTQNAKFVQATATEAVNAIASNYIIVKDLPGSTNTVIVTDIPAGGGIAAIQVKGYIRPNGAAEVVAPANAETPVKRETITQLAWAPATSDPNVAAVTKYDLTLAKDPNFLNLEKIVKVATGLTSPSYNLAANSVTLDYDTKYYWRVDSYVTWNYPNTIVNPIKGNVWTFAVQPADLIPVVKADANDKNILTSLELLPANVTGLINYQDAVNDIASVKWEVTSKQAVVAVKQMQDRTDAAQLTAVGALITSTGATVDSNFLKDWIGTDTREQGDPMMLTIKGLPAGTYTWKSYHHDINNQVGTFDMFVYVNKNLVNTVADQTQTAGTLATAIKTATTSITVASSSDVVDLVFNLDDNKGLVWNAFFVMNGFELSNGVNSMVVDFGVSGSHSAVANCLFYDAQNEVDSTFVLQSYSAFGTTVSLLPTWGTLLSTGATIVDTKNDHTSVDQSASFTTNETGVYVITFSATDGKPQTGSETMEIDVRANACAVTQVATPGFNKYDYNSDCKINILDFANFAKSWLEDKSATTTYQR